MNRNHRKNPIRNFKLNFSIPEKQSARDVLNPGSNGAAQTELTDKISTLENEIRGLKDKEKAIDSLLHEVRQINGELKRNIDMIDFEGLSSEYMRIWAQANLLSIRLKTYDLEISPDKILESEKYKIPLYRRIHKIYRCLDAAHFERNVFIRLNGNSYLSYEANDIIEIAFFIIIENAIKYAIEGSTINIDFTQKGFTQNISFRNECILPDRDEISKLVDRGYRGNNAVGKTGGNGIGLYTLDRICRNQNISLEFRTNKRKADNTGEFQVLMTFKNCKSE